MLDIEVGYKIYNYCSKYRNLSTSEDWKVKVVLITR